MTTPTPHGAMPELKPCPFCGQSHTLKITAASELFADEDEEVPYMHSETYAVICDASKPKGPGGCGGQAGFHDTEAEAIEAWNRRAAIQQAAGAVPEGVLAAAKAANKHWNDFGPEFGFDECMDTLDRTLAASPSPLGREAGSSDHLVACDGGGVTQPTPDDGSQYLDKLYLMQACIRHGWRMAAGWAKRDDLLADIGSPAYLKEMAEFLSKYINPTPGTPEMRVTDLSIDMDESLADYSRDDPLMRDPELMAAATAAVKRMEAPRPDAPTSQINPGSATREDGHE